jgi:hypothetical protein
MNIEIHIEVNIRLEVFGFDLIKSLLNKTLLFLLITISLHYTLLFITTLKFKR